jgi:protein gp37
MGDWFSPGVEPDWLRQIIDTAKQKPEHIFLVLTKRPDRIAEMLNGINIPKNLLLGTSITNQGDIERIGWLNPPDQIAHAGRMKNLISLPFLI